jgi:iron transport multicopper oxidase
MTVIEVDGVYVEAYETKGISLAVGQRVSVLITMDANPCFNYPIVAAMGLSHRAMELKIDQSMFDSPSANPNATAWLVYNTYAPLPEPAIFSEFVNFDDTQLIPLEPLPAVMYDRLVTANVNFTDINGINFAIVNGNTYKPANVPTLFTALTTGPQATDPASYGNTTNTFVLEHLDMVWIAINNFDTGDHPCTPNPGPSHSSSSSRPRVSSSFSQSTERRDF